MRQFAVILELPGTIVNGAVLFVSITLVDQCLDHINHPADLLRSQRIFRGRLDVHAFHVFFALCNIALRYLVSRHSLFNGLFNNLVIHVCKVGNKIHIIAFILEIPADCVEHDHRARISNMDKVIDGRSADIHPYFSFFQRNKLLLFPG